MAEWLISMAAMQEAYVQILHDPVFIEKLHFFFLSPDFN
jgi:hypothetical protein